MTAFSISEFRAFCENKPADEEYCYTSSMDCAIVQYTRSRGQKYDVIASTFDMPPHECAAIERPWTFGALAQRLRELEATP